jgi:hypothetical protein
MRMGLPMSISKLEIKVANSSNGTSALSRFEVADVVDGRIGVVPRANSAFFSRARSSSLLCSFISELGIVIQGTKVHGRLCSFISSRKLLWISVSLIFKTKSNTFQKHKTCLEPAAQGELLCPPINRFPQN